MAYPGKAPSGHTEFGGGPGIVDPAARDARAFHASESHIPISEFYATNPADPDSDPQTVPLERSREPWLDVPEFDPGP